MESLIFILVIWIGMVCLGMYVAGEKGRSSGEGFLLTFLFGPFGILIEALLPTLSKQPNSSAHLPLPDISDEEKQEAIRRYAEKQRLKAGAERQVFLDEIERKKTVALERRAERDKAYLARGITPGPLAWLESLSLRLTDWYKNASDLMQMLVWAFCLSVPAALIAVLIFRQR